MQYIINLTDAEYQKLVKDGVLQVISRRKNGTLQRFKKIMVETVSDSGNTSNLMQQIVKANQSALSAINEIGKNAVQISDTTKKHCKQYWSYNKFTGNYQRAEFCKYSSDWC